MQSPMGKSPVCSPPSEIPNASVLLRALCDQVESANGYANSIMAKMVGPIDPEITQESPLSGMLGDLDRTRAGLSTLNRRLDLILELL